MDNVCCSCLNDLLKQRRARAAKISALATGPVNALADIRSQKVRKITKPKPRKRESEEPGENKAYAMMRYTSVCSTFVAIAA